MAQRSWFFNSAPGDPRFYQASDFAAYFGEVLSTGLLHINNVPGLQVKTGGTDLRTYVELGGAIMEGYRYANTDNEYLNHSLPEVSLDRIDRIVLRLDKKNANRYIELFVLEGEPSTEPVAPTLQRDNLVWELSLAQVRIRVNTSTINPNDILDERLDRSVCGLVFSLISKPAMADIQTGGYAVTATVEGQTDFEIPLMSFDKVGDGLTVFVEGKKAEYSSYQVLYPRTVRFNIGLSIGTKVEFDIIRGRLILEDDYLVTAGKVGINDAGNYYDSENVEGALQEIGSVLFKPKPLIYGIEIDESNINPKTAVTYTDDAIALNIVNATDWDNHWPFNLIKPCVVQPTINKFVTYLNPMDYTKKDDGSPIDITSNLGGDVFVEIPIVWWKIEKNLTKLSIKISPKKIDDNWVALAHKKGDSHLDNIYLGAYLGYLDVDNKLRSLSGKTVSTPRLTEVNQKLVDYVRYATNNNCELSEYYSRHLLPYILFLIRYKNRNKAELGAPKAKTVSTGLGNKIGLYSKVGSVIDKFIGFEGMVATMVQTYETPEIYYGTTVSKPERTIHFPDNSFTLLDDNFFRTMGRRTEANNFIGVVTVGSEIGTTTTGYTVFNNIEASASTSYFGSGSDPFGVLANASTLWGTFRILYKPATPLSKGV